jgi:hypothetical protein
MIVYSKVANSYSKKIFLIKYLRNNKWFWDYKFFFEQLSIKQYFKLAKALLIDSNKVIFAQLEGLGHHWYYQRPTDLAHINFGFPNGKKTIYWNALLDEYACNRFVNPHYDYKKKSTSNLIERVCFISSNLNKIRFIQNNYLSLYKDLDIYGEFHMPIDSKLNLTENRHIDSLNTCSRYKACLCVENCVEEGYMQGSIFYSLSCMTPPILKASPIIKNFIRPEFYINFYDYLEMTKEQKLSAINKIQEHLFLHENYLTNLALDYIEFFKESFRGDNEPDIKKITLKSHDYRNKFIKI